MMATTPCSPPPTGPNSVTCGLGPSSVVGPPATSHPLPPPEYGSSGGMAAASSMILPTTSVPPSSSSPSSYYSYTSTAATNNNNYCQMSYSGGAPVGYPMSSLSPVTGGTWVESHHRRVIMVILVLGSDLVKRNHKYTDRQKSMQILLSRTQTGPGRTGKQEQEQTSRNHVQTL